MEANNIDKELTKVLSAKLDDKQVTTVLKRHIQRYKELMSYYRCAMMEVETKFNVLREELSVEYDHNPIESIRTRLKTVESIREKMERKGYPFTAESIEKNMHDIAGVRVICSFPEDIFILSEAFLKQDDIILLEKKDYISNPKPNGYKSLHLIVQIPIFLHDQKKMMKVEVQLRTIAMDCWASLEHKIRYKKELQVYDFIENELAECARIGNAMDERMESLHKLTRQLRNENDTSCTLRVEENQPVNN